jgi:hypothetical protein
MSHDVVIVGSPKRQGDAGDHATPGVLPPSTG